VRGEGRGNFRGDFEGRPWRGRGGRGRGGFEKPENDGDDNEDINTDQAYKINPRGGGARQWRGRGERGYFRGERGFRGGRGGRGAPDHW